MSDHEDVMDVDVPKDVQFSSENAGKKRTIADLPVEAQDNLPWSVLISRQSCPLANNFCQG